MKKVIIKNTKYKLQIFCILISYQLTKQKFKMEKVKGDNKLS